MLARLGERAEGGMQMWLPLMYTNYNNMHLIIYNYNNCLSSQIYSVLAGTTSINSSLNYKLVVKNLSRLIESQLYLKKLATFRNLKHKVCSVLCQCYHSSHKSYIRSCALENCLSNIKLNDIVYKTMGINHFKA